MDLEVMEMEAWSDGDEQVDEEDDNDFLNFIPLQQVLDTPTVELEGDINSPEILNRSLKKSLHCQLQDNRWFSMRYRRAKLDQGWGMYLGTFDLYGECDKTFMIQFEDQEGRDLMLQENPWSLDGGFMMVKSYLPYTILPSFKIRKTPLWVQIHGLPEEFLTPQKAVWIGTVAGLVLLIDGNGERTSTRLRIMIRPDEPLVAGVYLLRGNGEKTWVGFRYERVCVVCQKCGVIGHVRKDCDLNKEEMSQLLESKFSETRARMELDTAPIDKEVDRMVPCDHDVTSFLVRLHGASDELHKIFVGDQLNHPRPGKCTGLNSESEAVYAD